MEAVGGADQHSIPGPAATPRQESNSSNSPGVDNFPRCVAWWGVGPGTWDPDDPDDGRRTRVRPIFRGKRKLWYDMGLSGRDTPAKEHVRERLVLMDVDRYVAEMRPELERALRQVGEAVNQAPTGNLISGSEIQVREVFRDLTRIAFEKALQARIDSTESSFSPSAGRRGEAPGKQGQGGPQRQHGAGAGGDTADPLVRAQRAVHHADRPADRRHGSDRNGGTSAGRRR
jgi:hypothetical protein